MKNKSLLIGMSCYILWGILPLYWHMLDNLDPLFVLSNRIVWSLVLIVIVLIITKSLGKMREILMDKQKMKYLIPAAILITINWGTYIWAVASGKVLDSSLGYYMSPLVMAGLSVIVFKEKMTKMQVAALALAATGLIISAVQYGSFPYVALILAVSFSLYGMMKKFAHVDATVSIAVETLLALPLALIYIAAFGRGEGGIASVDVGSLLLLMGAGVVTALPMVLYAKGVNDLPFVTMAFFQYISPTMALFCGLLMGETLTQEKIVSFAFIGAGLVIFTIALIREDRKRKHQLTSEK